MRSAIPIHWEMAKNPHAVALGAIGGAMGKGSEKRRLAAKRAARIRWQDKIANASEPLTWNATWDDVWRAQSQLHRAIKRGDVIRPDGCQKCGGSIPRAHHDDYSKPLDVIWLCGACHSKRHKKLGWGLGYVSRKDRDKMLAYSTRIKRTLEALKPSGVLWGKFCREIDAFIDLCRKNTGSLNRKSNKRHAD